MISFLKLLFNIIYLINTLTSNNFNSRPFSEVISSLISNSTRRPMMSIRGLLVASLQCFYLIIFCMKTNLIFMTTRKNKVGALSCNQNKKSYSRTSFR